MTRMGSGSDHDGASDENWWLLPAEALLRGARTKYADRERWTPARARLNPWIEASDARDHAREEPPHNAREGSRTATQALCPSAAPREGASLFARVDAHGAMSWAPATRPIDARTARTLDVPVGRASLRLAAPCSGEACGFWHDHRCRLIDTFAEHGPREDASRAEACPIRDACRWRRQRGDLACSVCAGVTFGMFERW